MRIHLHERQDKWRYIIPSVNCDLQRMFLACMYELNVGIRLAGSQSHETSFVCGVPTERYSAGLNAAGGRRSVWSESVFYCGASTTVVLLPLCALF